MNVEAQRIQPAPIRKTIPVKASPDTAFRVFTGQMGKWWLKSHSLLGEQQKDIIIEPEAGGRWYEVGDDGTEMLWGRVLAWDEPERIVLAWQLDADFGYDPNFETTVEVRFVPEGDGTRVEFEHRDLERFGERAQQLRDDYQQGMDGGWAMLLDLYRQYADQNG